MDFDDDGNGYLDDEEFKRFMAKHNLTQDESCQAIAYLDRDFSRTIDYDEFASGLLFFRPPVVPAPSASVSGAVYQSHTSSSKQSSAKADHVLEVVQQKLAEKMQNGHSTKSARTKLRDDFIKYDGDINALIDQMDGDGNGAISLDEFMQVFGRARMKGRKQKQDTKMRLASLRERELLWIQDALRDHDSIQDAFRGFDRHGRNELTYQQFGDFMGQFGITSEDDISLLVKRLDADSSGTIDLQEFLSVFNEQRLAHQKNAAVNTKKERAAPSAALLQKRERASQLRKAEEMWIQRDTEMHGSVKVAFEKFDLDQSGELDYEEFRQLMTAFGISDREHMETLNKRLDVDSSGTIDFDEFVTIFYEERAEKYKDSVPAQSRKASTKSPVKTATEDKKARLARQRELEVKWMKRVLSCHQSIESAFNEYDEDGSCGLDHDEFRRFMTRYSIVRENDISSLIKRLDLDTSSTIDFEEFSSIFNPLRLKHGGAAAA